MKHFKTSIVEHTDIKKIFLYLPYIICNTWFGRDAPLCKYLDTPVLNFLDKTPPPKKKNCDCLFNRIILYLHFYYDALFGRSFWILWFLIFKIEKVSNFPRVVSVRGLNFVLTIFFADFGNY